jgi:hypothetical protein
MILFYHGNNCIALYNEIRPQFDFLDRVDIYHSRENTRSFIIVSTTGFFCFHAKHFGSFLDLTNKSWMGTKNIVPTLFSVEEQYSSLSQTEKYINRQ